MNFLPRATFRLRFFRSSALAVVLAGAALRGEVSSPNIFYTLPAAEFTDYYNEVTVLQSVSGSYFSTGGFSAGYCGLQEGGTLGGKQIQFSVWDPGQPNSSTTNTLSANQVELLWRSPDTVVERFGGEGIGVSTATPFEWQVGTTYAFLVRAQRLGATTTYRGYFFDRTRSRWIHLATLRSRVDARRFNGFFAFVEDFRRNATSETQVRRAEYGNTWARDLIGTWRELTSAVVVVGSAIQPPTANYRVASSASKIELANGGGITVATAAGGTVTRASSGPTPPTLPAETVPVIEAQPVSVTAVERGTATFQIDASGEAPSFQWKANGIDLPGATGNRLTLQNVSAADAAKSYSVRVSNPYGAVDSATARLTVTSSPLGEILAGVSRVAVPASAGDIVTSNAAWLNLITGTSNGQTAAFAAVRSFGAGRVAILGHEGFLDSNAESNPAFFTNLVRWLGQRTAPRVVYSTGHREFAGATLAQTLRTAGLSCTAYSGALPPAAVADVLVVGNAWGDFTAAEIADVQNWVNAGGGLVLAGLGWSWGPNNGGRPLSDYPMSKLAVPFGAGWGTATLSLGVASTNAAERLYSFVATTPPQITAQPVDLIVAPGATAVFRVTASGTGLGYQWYLNGAAIPGETTSTLSLANTHAGLIGGSYQVVVTNPAGGVASSEAALTVETGSTTPGLRITRQPASQVILAGGAAALAVEVTGPAPSTYQWFKDNIAISGATGASYAVSNASTGHAGSYRVIVSTAANAVTSRAATLTVSSPPVISAQPASKSVVAGQPASFTVTATGGGTLSYQWRKDGTAISGATSATLTLGPTQTSSGGSYDVIVTSGTDAVTSTAATLIVTSASRLSNVSVRTTLAAEQVVIVGLTMQGGSKSVLIRAAGPALGALGVPGTMADPRLKIYDGAVEVAANDNWGGSTTLKATMDSLGAFPFNVPASLDAAILRNLNGGSTVHISGPTAGNVIVEAYDAGSGNDQRLTNLSARNLVGTGDNVMIVGFVIAGAGNKNVLIRAVGPSLAPFGVTSLLADPKLELFNASGAKIGENDTYAASLAPTFASVAAFPLIAGSKDAALVVSLPPGSYTAQVSGADGGIGNAIVELFELP